MEKLFSKNCKMILSIILVLALIGIGTNSLAASLSIKFKSLPNVPITLNMAYYDTYKFKVIDNVASGVTKSFEWSVKNTKTGKNAQIVSITNKGVLKCVKTGSEDVTVSVTIKSQGSSKTISTMQHVYVEYIPQQVGRKEREQKLTLNKSSASMKWSKAIQLVAKEGNTRVKPKWSSSDKSIVSVTEDGKIKALKKGNTTIKAKFGQKVAICKIKVKKVTFPYVAAELKAELKANKVKYTYITFEDFETLTPLTQGYVDCSSYVSWVIYNYGKAKGINEYKNAFKASKDSSGIYNWCSNNCGKDGLCKKIGTLADNTKNLKPGDIIVKPKNKYGNDGHVEIFAKYSSNGTRLIYNCGSTPAINGDIYHEGASNVSTARYVVFRLTK